MQGYIIKINKREFTAILKSDVNEVQFELTYPIGFSTATLSTGAL